jgi:hypothetical protein
MKPDPKTKQYFTALKTHKTKYRTSPKQKINPRNKLRKRNTPSPQPNNLLSNDEPPPTIFSSRQKKAFNN